MCIKQISYIDTSMWYFSTTLHILTYKVSQLTNVNLTSMICSAIWNLLEKMKNKQDISTLNSGLIKWDECVHAQLCLTLCNPTDYLSRLLCPWNSQARILEWVAISSSRGSSQPRDRTHVSYITGRFFTIWATKEAHQMGLLFYCSVTQLCLTLCDPTHTACQASPSPRVCPS